jgi:hypothetical protein
MKLNEFVKQIETKDDLMKFIFMLRKDLNHNVEEWENYTLDSFLEAMEGWMQDMDGYYLNTNQPLPEQPSWKMIADILMAAKYYE